jgi:hypothetical protein
MTRAKHKTRGAATAATLKLETDVLSTKRKLKDIDRIIEQAKREEKMRRGGELVGRVPPMFLDIPETIIGGAETYFQEILSTTSKGFAKAFGEVKGARQLQIDAFRAFETERDSDTQESMDYITIASHVVVLLAFHLVNIAEERGFNLVDQKAIAKKAVEVYRAKFVSDGSITKALEAVLNIVGSASGSAPGEILITTVGITVGALSAMLGGLKVQALVYPLNLNWIKAKEKMIAEKFLKAIDKAKFLKKPDVLLAYRKYASSHEPKDSVALPSQISGVDADGLIKFFKESRTYSLEDTFLFYRAAYNATANVRKEVQKESLAGRLKVVAKAFDAFIEQIEASFFHDSASEARALKKDYLEMLAGNPTPADFAEANALLAQAKSAAVLDFSTTAGDTEILSGGIGGLGQEVFSDLDLVEMLALAGTAVDAADKGVWDAFKKIESLTSDLTTEALGPKAASEIDDLMDDAFKAAKTTMSTGIATNVTSEFKSNIKETLKASLEEIVSSFNSTFTASERNDTAFKGSVTPAVIAIFNQMLEGYTEPDDAFVADSTTNSFAVAAGINFSNDAIAILADGDSLDIYNSSTDEFGNQAIDILLEQLRQKCISEGISNAIFTDVENFIIDSAEVLQVVLDSMYQEALRDPDIAIFKNPAYSTLALVGVGTGSLVGTHALTALSQRLMNSEGKTEGGAFYAAESIVPAAVAATGLYLHMHSDEHGQLGIPLIAGAAGSVLLRVLTRKFIDNAVFKYIGAAPAAFIGDKTFGGTWDEIQNGKAAAPAEKEKAKSGYIPFSGNSFFDQEGVDDMENYESLGRYEQVPMHDPFWTYNAPTEISYEQANKMMEQRGGMYAAPAGLDGYGDIEELEMAEEDGYEGLGRYEQVPMHDPFYSYNAPTEITYDQANKMMEQRGNMYAAPAGLDGVDDEVLGILDASEPLTSQEIYDEGFDGYVDETVIQLNPYAAKKVHNAGAGQIIGRSQTNPNTMLLKVGQSEIGVTGMEGGIVKEYNPSLPSGDFGADMIEPPPANSINTSGLFSRGAFSSRLPTIRENFDY